MNVLITGANGFIGRNMVKRFHDSMAPLPRYVRADDKFLAEKIKVTGLDKDNGPHTDVLMDVRELADWKPLEKYDAVIHLAAKSGVRNFSESDHENNLEATTAVCEWMLRNDVGLLINASSSSVYGNSPNMSESWPCQPISPYGHSKWYCEKIVKKWAEGQERIAVNLRVFNAIGRDQRADMFPSLICEHLKEVLYQPSREHLPVLPVYGARLRAWTHVNDVCNAFWSALDTFYHARRGTCIDFNVGTDGCCTQRGLIDLFEERSGIKANVRYVDPHPLDVNKTKADMSRFTSVFGWHPNNRNVKVGVEEVLRQYGLI